MLTVQVLTSSSMLQPLDWKEAKLYKVLFQITATNANSPGNANPYVAGGDTLNLAALMTSTAAGAPGKVLPTFELSPNIPIMSRPNAPGPNTQYTYRFCPGTNLLNGTMQVILGGNELAAGNYPAAVLTDIIIGEAYFVMP